MAGCLGHWVSRTECGRVSRALGHKESWCIRVSRALGHKESVAGCLGHWVTKS